MPLLNVSRDASTSCLFAEVWNHIYWGVRSYQVGILLALPEMIVAANASVFRGVEPDLVVVIRSLLKKTIQVQ